MKTEEQLNIWWNGIDLNGLLRLFYCPPDKDYNDFIDDCDEWWADLQYDEKLEVYYKYREDVY